MDKVVELYMENIVRLHDTPVSIVSNRDARFTSRVWKEIYEATGAELKISIAFCSVLYCILKLMDNLKELSRSKKICLDHVFWIGKAIGKTKYL